MTTTPGPEGAPPLPPQTPPYGQPPATPPYPRPPEYDAGSQPGPYPAQAPLFIAPAQTYRGQPYQGQPYQGQPYAGQPYQTPFTGQPPYATQGPPFMPGPGSPPVAPQPDRVPAKYGVLAISAVVLVAVIGVAIAVWSMNATPTTPASVWTAAPTPTLTRTATPSVSSSAFPSTAANCSGTKAGTLDWAASVPTGWSCAYEAGNEVTITNSSSDVIMVRATNEPDATTACTVGLNGAATMTALPDTTWGKRAAKTSKILYQGLDGEARCVRAMGYTFIMLGLVRGGTLDTLVAAENALTQSWVWKA